MSQRIRYLLPTTLNVFAIATSTLYLRSRINYNLEEQEARLDEIEGMEYFPSLSNPPQLPEPLYRK